MRDKLIEFKLHMLAYTKSTYVAGLLASLLLDDTVCIACFSMESYLTLADCRIDSLDF